MIKVMIVDDSAVARSTLREVFSRSDDILVIGSAPDPLIAYPMMEEHWPDVIVTDIEMPRMDGIRFLQRITDERPTPVIVFSSMTDRGVQTAMDAIKAGAFDVIPKPSVDVSNFIRVRTEEILTKVRAAYLANIANLKRPEGKILPAKSLIGESNVMAQQDKIVAIGISNGGIQALQYLLSSLPEDCNGMVIVQHIPTEFIRKMVHQLNRSCRLNVKLAKDGDYVLPGQVLIAPGGKDLRVINTEGHYRIEILDGAPDAKYCPSVDVLFHSVAHSAGKNAMGIIMTGFGSDGAAGLKELADKGAHTLAQDEASSVVFGMPREAIKLGAARHVVSLYDLPEHIYNYGR